MGISFYTGKSIILNLLFLLFAVSLSAQVKTMRFTEPFDEDQLTSNMASCITQDSLGFIWIGTSNGLNCFNGDIVKHYKYSINDSTSLVNNTINTLFVDHSGRIWIGTLLGICVYNPLYDNFSVLASEKYNPGLESLQINAIGQNSNNDIYISAGNTIYKFNQASEEFDLFHSINEGIVNNFIIDESDNFWIASSENGGVEFFNPEENKIRNFKNTGSSNSLSVNNIRDLAILDEKLWIATYGGGINSMDLNTFKVKRYPPPDQYAGYITDLYIDNENNLWSHDLTGIKMYDKANDVFFGYYTIPGNENSIKNSAVTIFQDKQGNFWTVHAPGGIGIVFNSKGFDLYDNNPNNSWHTSDNNITSIAFDQQGNWWLGNGFNGIDIFNWQDQYVQTFNDVPDDPYSLGKGGVMCIFKDRKDKMWIGTNLGGLQYFDEKQNRFYTYLNNPDDSASIANNDIRSIAEDKDGNLWIVTHGKGIDRYKPGENEFFHYTNSKNGLANDWAFQVLIDADETLWAATAYGLSKLENGSDKFKSYFSNPSDSNSICHNLVNCIYEDSDHQIWIGTNSGLNRYNPETDNFTRIDSGFISNNIAGIQGSREYLWISTSNGISRYNKETGLIYNFDEQDGLMDGTYQVRSVAKNSEGAIFFGGDMGLTVFDPDKIKFNTQVPEVFITELSVSNQPVIKYGNGSVLDKNIKFTKKITLKHNQNTLSFRFVSGNLINFNKNQYKFRLEGIDKGWVYSGNDNYAYYPYLRPGIYTFRVTASNNDNIWNETGVSLQIRILHPWYYTLLAKIIYGIVILVILILIFYYRTASLNRRNKWLAEKVEERTQRLFAKNELLKKQKEELDETNRTLTKRQQVIQQQADELKSQGEELKVIAENLEETNKELVKTNNTKDKLFSIIGHDLRNPFNVILGYSDLLIENLKEWDDDQRLEIMLLLKESSTGAYNLLDNLLNWSRSQSGSIEFYPEKVSVKNLTQNVLSETSMFASKKDIRLIPSIDKDLFLWADSNMLKLICRNILMNAVKFSNQGGRIYFNVNKYDASSALFEIKDEGIGIPNNKLNKLFEISQEKSSVGTEGEKGTGLGLILCEEFVIKHGGIIWVESREGKGSSFFFTIPIVHLY